MKIDPKSPEGIEFFKDYAETYGESSKIIRIGDKAFCKIVKEQLNSYESRTELECITPGAAEKIVAKIKRDLAAKATASASATSSSAAAEAPKAEGVEEASKASPQQALPEMPKAAEQEQTKKEAAAQQMLAMLLLFQAQNNR